MVSGVAKITGHATQRQALVQLARDERLPSSLLFSGIPGTGKRLVALELAAQLLCLERPFGPQGGCGSCRACALLRSGNHPDLHTLAFGENGATVDDLREALEKLSLKPFMGGRKVAVLNDADKISIVGANILLKSLEEPRPETFYILVAANTSRLPATILSRCQRWFFDRLSVPEVQEILAERGAVAITESAAALTDGSLLDIDSLGERAELWDDVRSTLEAAYRGDVSKVGKAAQAWGSDKSGLRARLDVLRSAIRQNLLSSAHDRSAAAVWAHALQNALDTEYLALDRHVNPTLVLLQLLDSCSAAHVQRYQSTPNSATTILQRLQD
jgi:hypothetical protein